MPTVKDFVEETIDQNKIAIFSKSWCPYCKKAKELLKGYSGVDAADVKILELDEIENGGDIQEYLRVKTGQKTVPNIFINKTHVGGSDNLTAAEKNGKLRELINGSS